MIASRWRAVLLGLIAAAGCRPPELTLRYHVELELDAVVSIATYIIPVAPRRFSAEVPETPLGEGLSYRVSCGECPAGVCDEGCGPRMRIDADRSRGFVLAPELTLRFRENEAAPAGRLVISADAFAEGARSLLRRPPSVEVEFAGDAAVDLYLRTGLPCGASSCARDQLCCGEADPVCADPIANVLHCGGCGRACGAGETCQAGTCRCGDGPACKGGDVCCGAVGCVDLDSDPKHCGGCDNPCNPGERCVAGRCACPTNAGEAACAVGQKCCGGSQGGCRALAEGCPCGGGVCTSEQMCCGSSGSEACATLAVDEQSCGQCGRACAAGLDCNDGLCTCAGGTAECKDTCCAMRGCRNLETDNTDCGSCGVACKTIEGEACVAGKCLCGGTDCAQAGKLCCGGACARGMTHCTGCGQGCSTTTADACARNLAGEWGCRCGGGPACGGGQRCCGGMCVDVNTDKAHCGGCGVVCPPGGTGNASAYRCFGGSCVREGCDPACPANEICNVGSNTCSCGGGVSCGADRTCCPSSPTLPLCKSLQSDSGNCGMCGRGCGDPEVCTGGQCLCNGVACGPNQVCCTGGNGAHFCSSLDDASSCGGCGVRCGHNEVCDIGGRCLCVYSGEHGAMGAGRVCTVGKFCAQDVMGCKLITQNSCPTQFSASGTFCGGGSYCCAECPTGPSFCAFSAISCGACTPY